ncbi:hypothetical protein EAY31_20485 [Vibrio anguillarum]|nr:hypothetical protein [Vibrio anguillarum]MBF4300968.1 hypothetical protein [Vibrio anguillarum]MBF4400101.1 hypothetical protein [Vibrio anguillarum]MBF4441419.1 hypothetical protein [Vibrio anguillarum]
MFTDVSKSAWFAQIITFLSLFLMPMFVGCFIQFLHRFVESFTGAKALWFSQSNQQNTCFKLLAFGCQIE